MTRRTISRSTVRAVTKRGAVATLTLGLTLAPLLPAGSVSARPATTVSVVGLTSGARGDAVRVLQQALINSGVTVVGGADGVFGAATAAAVSAFQQAKGLSVTGAVDDATASALGLAPAAPSPLLGLRIGSRGDAVRQLQQTLVQAGYDLFGGADGVFGVATANALSQFQYARGLKANARVDDATVAALGTPAAVPAAPATPAPAGNPLVGLAPGSTGLNVKALQQRLLDLGVTVRGGADGLYGPATANALKQFQTSQGITATGKVDDATAAALANPKPAETPTLAAAGLGFAVYGERGDRVRALQQALLNAGITFRGGADGVFGAGTAGAIVSFQKAKGLQVTGTVDQSTGQALGLQPLGAPAAAPTPAASSVTLKAFPVQRPCGYVNTWLQSRGGGRIHEGTDVIAKEGQEVYAVADGKITRRYWAESAALTGNGVRITAPDGTYFFYAHLLDVAPGIELGVPVTAGQLIGHVGKTGNTTVAHLHFEVHPGGGAAIDPTPILTAAGGC
jgi:peptidoglycan hydrolase-like protein with peptidoglycan-binding domain